MLKGDIVANIDQKKLIKKNLISELANSMPVEE